MFEGIKKRINAAREAGHNDPEFFLTPVISTDPIPFLFDGDGYPLQGDGQPVESMQEVAPGIRKLMAEAMGIDE